MSKSPLERCWDRLRDNLHGSCCGIPGDRILERCEFDLRDPPSMEEIEEAMLDRNLERCSHCDWWYDSDELIDENDNPVGCPDCRSSRG